MSLDVYLKVKEPIKVKASSGIFVRSGGRTMELTEAEWFEKYPDREPVRFNSEKKETCEVFHYNITHNLNKMADEAGLYEYLWDPESLDVKIARDMIVGLSEGLVKLKKNPDSFKALNPSNGWGTYDGLVEFVEKYLIACITYQEAEVEIDK